MSSTIKDVVINLALKGVSAANTAVDQLSKSLQVLQAAQNFSVSSTGPSSSGQDLSQAVGAITSIVSTLKSMSTEAKGAAGAGGGGGTLSAITALANPMTLLTGAVVGTAVALRQLNVWTNQFREEQAAQATKYRSITLDAANASVGRHARQSRERLAMVPDYGEIERPYREQKGRSENEAKIREAQAKTTRGHGWQQEIRSRMERSQSLAEAQSDAENKLKHIEAREKVLKGAATQLTTDRANTGNAHQQKEKSIRAELLARPSGGAFGKGSIFHSAITGDRTTAQVDQFNAAKQLEVKGANVDRAGQVAAEERESLNLQKESLALGVEKGKAAAQLLNTLREQAAVSRKNYESDKETVASANRTIGGMKPGDINRLKRLEQKRIDAMQKGSKVRLTQADLETVVPEGTRLHDYLREQKEQRGAGVLESSVDLKASKAKAEADQKKLDDAEPGLLKEMQSLSEKNKTAADELVKSLEGVFQQEETFAKLKELFDHERERTAEHIKLMSSWIK